MNTSLLVATAAQPSLQDILKIPRLGIGHGKPRHYAPLFCLAAHGGNAHPCNEANDAVGYLDADACHVKTVNDVGFSQRRWPFAHLFRSVGAECPNPVLHARASNFLEALLAFNPRVFVPAVWWLRDACAVTPRAQAVST